MFGLFYTSKDCCKSTELVVVAESRAALLEYHGDLTTPHLLHLDSLATVYHEQFYTIEPLSVVAIQPPASKCWRVFKDCHSSLSAYQVIEECVNAGVEKPFAEAQYATFMSLEPAQRMGLQTC